MNIGAPEIRNDLPVPEGRGTRSNKYAFLDTLKVGESAHFAGLDSETATKARSRIASAISNRYKAGTDKKWSTSIVRERSNGTDTGTVSLGVWRKS